MLPMNLNEAKAPHAQLVEEIRDVRRRGFLAGCQYDQTAGNQNESEYKKQKKATLRVTYLYKKQYK